MSFLKTMILVRHSEPQRGTDLPNAEIPLSEEGRRLAMEFFAGEPFASCKCVYSSPYLRAVETARCLSKQITFDERLVERTLGDQECLNADFWLEQYQDLDFKNRNGESLNEAARRVDACVSDIRDRLANGEKAVVVSHAAAICAYLTRFCTITVLNAEEKIRRIQFEGRTVLQGKIHTPSAFVLRFEGSNPVDISYIGEKINEH